MPTPAKGYFLKDGTKVPGTTTILSRFKESGGLLQWAFKQGKEGKDRLYDEAEKAADIGTCAHGMVEMSIEGKDHFHINAYLMETLSETEMQEKAISAFNAYLKWAENFKVQVIAKEIQLVSEAYRYGGTPDAIGLVGNSLCLLDWKTSGRIYTDNLIQLAAYKNLWEENNPEQPVTGGFHLLRFAKENGDFGHHHFSDLSEAWRQFVLLREAYDIDKVLKKRAA